MIIIDPAMFGDIYGDLVKVIGILVGFHILELIMKYLFWSAADKKLTPNERRYVTSLKRRKQLQRHARGWRG